MASFEIYIKNYKAQNGNIVSVERLMQTIPMTSDPVITNPKVKTDLGKAGSFEFGLEMNSPYYDAMLQMKTILRVVYFGVTIFRGRVLTIDKSFQRSRTVHCEGDLAFLIDSHQIGQKEESRPETDLFTYLTSVIAQHNSDVADAEKRFTLGEVPMGYSQSVLSDQMVNIPADKAIQKYGNSSYDTSMDRLESLLSDFGGYMRTRYDSSNGTTYLDWYDNYYNPYVGQDIEVLSNLIDLSGPTEVENLFTVVLPIGKKDNGEVYINEWWPKVRLDHAKVNYITVPELATVPLYSDAELTSGYHRKEDYTNAISRFGRIWKVVEFENANTPQKLFTYAKDWIKNNFMPELTQWDVSALDMRFIDGQTRALYTGDRIKLVHPEVDQNYMYITIISAEYDLYNPDKNKFKIGVPNQQLNASYGVKQKSKGAKSFNSGITDLSSLTNDLEQQINGALEAIKRDRDILQQQYILKTTYGHDIGLDDPLAFLVYETDCITEKDPKEIAEATSKVIQKLEWTKKLKYPELVQSAWQKSLDTGLPPAPWDDLQNVIDNTFEIKQQQATFKATAMIHLTQDLGLPEDQAVDLLNDPSALYEAASLVDDNGNWTQKAIDKGALVWNQDRKALCVHAHKVVNNQGSSIGTNILGSSVGWLTGGSLDINNYLSLDGLTNQFDLGNIINTQDFTDSLTGISEKVISMIGGQFDLSEITNTLTGLKNKAVSALGDLFSGTKIEDTVNNLTNKAVSFVDDLFSGTKIENTLTGVKDKAINFIGGLFSGSSKEKDGSADTDKSVNILSGLITGSDQETESTGEKRSFFDMLGGLFTGGETKESSATEAIKTFFLGNGNAEIDGEHGTANFGDGYEWMVKINDTVGNKDGFVSAKDFQTFKDIPSFKTQFAAIKILFADQATINTTITNKLTAVEAYIDKINANKIAADTLVSASTGNFSTLDVSGTAYLPYQTTYIYTSDEQKANVGKALNGCISTFKDGHWKLSFSCLDGTAGPEPDFNLAESEWFGAQVSAATNIGWDSASSEVDIPKTHSISDRTVTIRTPYSRELGQNVVRGTDTNTYTLQTYSKNEVCLNWDQGNNGDGTIVAVFPHNQYTAGQDSITYSFTKATNLPPGTNATNFVFSDLWRYHITKDGTDVTDVYYKVPLAKVSKGTWGTNSNAGKISFTPGVNGDSTASVSLNIVPSVSWSNASVPVNPTFRVYDGNQSTNLTGTFYLHVNDDAVYVKSNSSNPVVGTNVLAKTTNTAYSNGFSLSHNSITLSQTGSSVVGPGKTVTIYPKAKPSMNADAANITSISAVISAPTAIKTDKVVLTSNDISDNVSKTGIIVHYSDRSTTNALEVLVDASAVYSAGVTQGEGQGAGAGYAEGYSTGQNNVSAQITGIAYHTKTASYSNGVLEVGADASGTITKTPQTGSPVTTNLAGKYAILSIPVTVTPVTLKAGTWNSSTKKISVTKNSGGTVSVDGEAIAVDVTGLDITVTPGSNTIGEPSHQGNGVYSLSATGEVTINGTKAYLSGSDSFTATEAIDYGKTLVKISKGSWGTGTNAGKISFTTSTTGDTSANVDLDIAVTEVLNGQNRTNQALITVKDGGVSTNETKSMFLTQGTWSNNKRIVQLRAGNTSSAVVAESEVDASTIFENGKKAVTVTNASVEANSVVYSNGTARGDMLVRLSNMDSDDPSIRLTGIIFDNIYQDGLNGGSDYKSTADFEFDLTDGSDVWSEYLDNIDVSDIYQQGVHDATPVVVTFIYDANGNLVTAYSTAKVMPASSDIYGKLYPNTEINYVKDVTVKSSSITRTYAECTYYGATFYVLKSCVHTGTTKNSPTKYGKATGWYSGGSVSYDYNGVVSFDSGNSVTIYSQQSTSSSAVTTVQNEVTVKCMYNPNGYAEEWMPVKYGNYTGYLESKYIYGTNAWNTLHPTVPVLQNISVEWIAHSTSDYTKDVSVLIDTTKGNAETVTCQYWPTSAYNAITAQSSVDVIEQYLEHVYLNSFLSHVQLSGMPSQINAKIRLRLTYSGESEPSYINLATTSVGQMVYQYTSTVYADSGSTVNIRSSATGGGSVVTAVPIGATIYCFDNPNGYPETSTYMRVKYGQYEGYMMAKFIVGTDAYNDAYGGGDEPSDPTITSREISIVSVAHMSSTTSVSPISTRFNINTPTYTGEGGVTTLVVNSTAIPNSAYNNYGSGYTKLNSIAGYFSSVRHGSGTYSNALEHGVIFTVTTHYSSGSISSKTYVGYITSNPR